ncbi:MAG: NADH-quinone oxidoreductase subunit C [Dehalococcoidia bacterium]|nr:NADH-quinone oxidoreductase subunit C [Chloroflexi bacterium CFX7]MCK6564262.1 NADH-quinone oxidoreductase subunit C [Dehalococcoidia bacterium]NUQ55484.1 NADH-quinone oxidoreductase subunit C [Dehalococcoidia bacterium]RIL02841.1 MAG: hypothetical protein DCC78_05185 [bacterium]
MSEEKATLPPLAATIKKALPRAAYVPGLTKTDLDLRVAPAELLVLVQGLKDNPALDFDYLRNMTGIDMQENGLELKYHLYSFKHGHTVQITVATPPGESHLPTLTGLYAAANWHEREAAEMFGFVFDGHPDPRNLLLEEDLRIHPLLKAHPLQPIEVVQGIEDGKAGFDF